MNRMAANIATWRRSHPRQAPLPHPRAEEARQPNGSVCPTCLHFGRQGCKEHRATDQLNHRDPSS